ncbi:MAG: tetratricopeptide repeat protein, partial [Deltaproteobacteria bacterium]|nr:tetratricopeptide repeat protein [Deltaproteobacteria bacterium]
MSQGSEHDDESTVQRAVLRQRAEQLESAGDWEQARLVYEQLVALNRRDSMPLLKIGDLQLKLEHFAEAVAAYGRAAECYRREGALPKALAVYTQMRVLIRGRAKHLEPRYADLPLRLAETHAALGQRAEAARLFSEVVGPLMAGGQAREALQVVDQMMALDRQNPTAHLLQADCHAKLGQIDKAVASAGVAAETLVSQGKIDEAIAVLERLLAYWPEPAYARVTARIYLARGHAGDAIAALQKLQICFAADPSDLPTLELLAAVFEDMDQPHQANRVLEEAARAAQTAGQEDDYERLARKLLDRDPD